MSKYIVVHAGARDQYKLAQVLYKNGKLGYIVTDDIIFRKKYRSLFPRKYIKISWSALFIQVILKIHNFGEGLQMIKTRCLGRTAGKLSQKKSIPLLALQEYAYHAYQYSGVRPRIVFQFHPQAEANKEIFDEEIARHPESESFQDEVKIYTPRKIQEARDELRMTDYYIAASSFTKQTLVENGAEQSKVFVAPYGVNTEKFSFRHTGDNGMVTFLFVGSFVERKGVHYLIMAAERLEKEGYKFKLKMVSRSDANASKLKEYGLKCMDIQTNLPFDELVAQYHSSDVFVFPSLFEGFAFVIVEAMATGIPVITTPRTVGLDIVEDGENGFLVNPSDADDLYEKMKYFILNPGKCQDMGKRASLCAKSLTWDNFEKCVIEAVNSIENNQS